MPKITDSELEQLNLLKQDSLEIASILGDLNFQKTVLEIQIEDQKQKVKDLKAKELVFFEKLRELYGNVTINISTGEFN